jgi:hypothetical protein
LMIKWDKPEEKALFEKTVTMNFWNGFQENVSVLQNDLTTGGAMMGLKEVSAPDGQED